MSSKIFAFVCIQLAVFNAVYSQCINRVPNCGCSNILPVAETILPNQVFVNQLGPYLPSLPNGGVVNQLGPYLPSLPNQVVVNPTPCAPKIETIVPSPYQTTTIIQDSTVANNLANALQLLVVSNLLSNTLPTPCGAQEVLLPGPAYAPYSAPLEFISPLTSLSPYGCAGPCGCGGYNGYNILY